MGEDLNKSRGYLYQARKWFRLLLLSGGLNIACIAVLFLQGINSQEKRSYDFHSHTPSQDIGDSFKQKLYPYTFSFSKMTFARLVEAMDNEQVIHNKFKIKHLALSCLYSFYDLNIEKAQRTSHLFQEKRQIETKIGPLYLLMGISPQSFDDIRDYLHREKWPFTPQGLFKRLKLGWYEDPSLKQAFYKHSEFYVFYTQLIRFKPELLKEEVLALMLEGEWEQVEAFFLRQKNQQNFTKDSWRALLQDYIDLGSQRAAKLLVELDGSHVALKGGQSHQDERGYI